MIKLFLEALNVGIILWLDQRLVLNSYSSVKNRTLAVSDSKVAEMNILKLMAVLGLATATSFCFLRKSWESGYSCSVGPKIICEMTSQIWIRLTSDFYSVNYSYIGSKCNFELCDFGDLRKFFKKYQLEIRTFRCFFFFLIITIFLYFSVFLLILFIYLSYLFGCAESSFL